MSYYGLSIEEIEYIESMPYKERVSVLFKMFPKHPTYFEELCLSVQYGKRGIKVSFCMEDIYNVEVYVEGLGTIRKYWEEAEFTELKIYRFSFCIGDDYGPGIRSKEFNREDSEIMCDRMLPFMLSYGHDKRQIPLLINEFPEFSKFALEYVP